MVVASDTGLHDMNHRLRAVDDDPFTVGLALDPGLWKACRAHRIAHAGSQRLGLAVGGSGGDDDPLKKRRQVHGIEHLDVLGLDIFQPVDDDAL